MLLSVTAFSGAVSRLDIVSSAMDKTLDPRSPSFCSTSSRSDSSPRANFGYRSSKNTSHGFRRPHRRPQTRTQCPVGTKGKYPILLYFLFWFGFTLKPDIEDLMIARNTRWAVPVQVSIGSQYKNRIPRCCRPGSPSSRRVDNPWLLLGQCRR